MPRYTRPASRPRGVRESDIQASFFAMIEQTMHPAARREVTFCIPNQLIGTGDKAPGYSARLRARIFKHMRLGLCPGASDVICTWPNHTTGRILFLEFKVQGEKVRDNQIEFGQIQESLGHVVWVVFTPGQAFDVWAKHVGIRSG